MIVKEKSIEQIIKENWELKEQIEKMKCCHNCKHFHFSCTHDDCYNLEEWELADQVGGNNERN